MEYYPAVVLGWYVGGGSLVFVSVDAVKSMMVKELS